uniref:PREDICTED: similar to copiatype polyprotein putative n=1 Tax=Albugo laibachii Nc14 TaxID=890382 RepID=F0WY59_9STRA|nr:PREDICTED: similar to copiatype polyprotein putative [Albugo laibachii Nc14]|eukprot:CCA26410.1 PREDICTED: similar to copiatype polyprotein putative [Albugo laibachii Nc14]
MPEQANAAIESHSAYERALESGEAFHWKNAIGSDIKSLDDKKTWNIIDRPKEQKLIGCKWVFAVKRDKNGKLQRYKAQMVVQGCRQTGGVEYTSPYALVASTSSIRVFLSLCVQLGRELYQYDVDTAFLNGHLGEDLYMWPLPGLKTKLSQVCKL